MNKLLIVGLILSSFCIQAQEIDAENLASKSYPVEGNWYNTEESGTGYIVHIQKGYVFGMYFGYNEVGEPRWMSFQGQLQESEKAEVDWELTSTLTSFQDGNTFNEQYQAPIGEESEHTIHFEFGFSQSGQFAVDEGDYQKIEPLNYRVETIKLFDNSDYRHPKLSGVWSFSYEVVHPDVNGGEPYIAFTDMLGRGHSNRVYEAQNGNGFKTSETFQKFYNTFPFEIYPGTSLQCKSPDDADVACEIKSDLSGDPFAPNIPVQLPDLGAFYFEADLNDIYFPYTGAENAHFTKIKAERFNYLRMTGSNKYQIHDFSTLLPVAGNWYNPEEPGTGYVIDIQRGYVFGFYFGYNEDGEQRWMSFQGELEESKESGVRWELSSVLSNYTGGNAFNETYKEPTLEDSEHNIHFEFSHTHGGRFSVDGGDYQSIEPLNYRVETENVFSGSDFLFPDLTGQWVFNNMLDYSDVIIEISENEDDNLVITPERSHYNFIAMIGGKQVTTDESGVTQLTYDISEHYYAQGSTVPELLPVGQIQCSNAPDAEIGNPEVNCQIVNHLALALGVMKDRFPSFEYDDYTNEVLTIDLKDMGGFQFNAIFDKESDENFDGFQIDARRANFIDFYNTNNK